MSDLKEEKYINVKTNSNKKCSKEDYRNDGDCLDTAMEKAIGKIAYQILKKYRDAFEELAK